MTSLRFVVVYVLSLLGRFFPFPTRTGIIKIGNPGVNAPVFVTGNYVLTVELMKKSLNGMDAYMLVANSRGINVWCAATGGLFNNHSIISVLKTTGIEDLVNHRTYILPQLAATGIEPLVIQNKTGWRGMWGPVYSRNIKAYVNNDFEAIDSQREVTFPAGDRLEMAITWSVLISFLLFLGLIFFSTHLALIQILSSWVISVTMFLMFPFLQQFMKSEGETGRNLLNKSIVVLLVLPIPLAIVYMYHSVVFTLNTGEVFLSVGLGIIIILVLISDLKGSTPTYKSDLHEDRLFKIRLEEGLCEADGTCVEVCPRNCFVLHDDDIVQIPREEQCVQCGACVVQCPFDALYFENSKGERLLPETIRTYKLNLMGKRATKTCSCTMCKLVT